VPALGTAGRTVTEITIMRSRYVRGWPRHEQGERVYQLDLGAALARPYSTDAHFTAYRSPNGRRLTGEALDHGIAVELTAIVFDCDCANVHGTPEPAPREWREDFDARVARLDADHPGAGHYHTRGGGRIVYAQPEPTIIRTKADARDWRQRYAVAIAYLGRRYGIEADPACSDWQRLYRLPRATRDGGAEPECYPLTLPNPIGSLRIRATGEDLARARQSSRAFHSHRSIALTHRPADGLGLFYHLLRARGDVGSAHGEGTLVRCPNRAQHTSGADWDTSTVLYAPGAGEEMGLIHCKHGHCVDLTVRDWLGLFSEAELDAALRAAGIVRPDRRAA